MKNKLNVLSDVYCAGVYGMRCKKSQEYLYIGSSLEINDALSRHLYYLKRGLYADTNKEIIQKYYDLGELVFEVVKESCHDKVTEMSSQEKENLHKALSVLEQFYIELNKDTICNKQMTVKKFSSSPNKLSTYRRRMANIGNKNPNCLYDEKIIAEILWLKLNGYKPKEISRLIEENYGIDINTKYISAIGLSKWIHIEGKKPDWVA